MRIKIFIFIAFLFHYEIIYSQCSDAGFCSIGALRSNQEKDTLRSNFILSQFIALGEQKTLHLTFYHEINLKISSGTALQIKIPYSVIIGNLATTNGIGDISLSVTQSIFEKEKSVFRITLGTKIHLVKPDKNIDGKPLPMVYQTTIGTNDLIAGIAYFHQKWIFSAGYQHSFNSNNNSFLHTTWLDNQDAKKYFESNHLKRADDVMLRAERKFTLLKNKKLYIGLLPIYHLQKDIIEDDFGNKVAVPQSDGITLNLSTSILFPLKNNYILKISSGNPLFLTRHSRPDGLTRTFNLGFHLQKSF